MAFAGEKKRNNAVKAAMQMSWFCSNVLKPVIESYFQSNLELQDMNFDFGIGVDCGKVLVVRGGIKGENNNDLVWVGNATNYAVKFSSLKDGYRIYISDSVYKALSDDRKLSDGTSMWERQTWNEMTVYRSNYHWSMS